MQFTNGQGKYIKNLPLHPSQEILEDNSETGDLLIKLNVYITFDFIQELLHYGKNVKVIAPQSLVDLMKEEYKNALQQYEEI